jgi:hypothetical protein
MRACRSHRRAPEVAHEHQRPAVVAAHARVANDRGAVVEDEAIAERVQVEQRGGERNVRLRKHPSPPAAHDGGNPTPKDGVQVECFAVV